MNVYSRGVRNAFRNPIRTFSLVIILGLSIGLALAMLVAYQAVGQKIKSVQSSVGNTVSISPAGVRGFEGGGSALTQDQLAAVSKLSNVTSVDESLNDRLTTSNSNLVSAVEAGALGQRFSRNSGQTYTPPEPPSGSTGGNTPRGGTTSFTPPVTLIGTTEPTSLANGGTFTLKDGKVFDGSSSEYVAVVGSTLATKNNLTVGSTFTAYDTTITVVGIFDAGNSFSNNQVIMPLASVQKLSDQAGQITSASVNVNSVTNVDSVTAAVKSALGTNADVTNSSERAKETTEPLQNIQTISLYSLIGAIIAGSVIILLTMVMIVRERRREIGVLKAIGASNAKVMTQFTTEALTLTMLGAVIGVIIGFIGGNPITKMLVKSSASNTTNVVAGPGGAGRAMVRGLGGVRENLTNIQGVVGWSTLVYGLLAALIIAFVGSAIASYFIAKVRPAEVMRAE